MSARSRRRLLFFVLAAAAAWLWSARRTAERVVLPAVEAGAFGEAPQLWERLKAMGVAAVVLREESAATLVAAGSVLYFSRAEVEKWRALGLVAAGGWGPQPDSLWTKDAKALARLTSALAKSGILISTAVAADPGGWVLALPSGVDLARVPAGFDPEIVSELSAAGLIAVAASTGSSVSPYGSVAGQRFWIRSLPVTARAPELLRAAHGRPRRLLILRPSPGLGFEENLDCLRAALKVVKRAGLPAALGPSPTTNGYRPSPFGNGARLLLFYAIGLLGPLLAARVGLRVERRVRSWVASHAPISAPVPEVLAGLAAVWAAASAAGLLAAALPQAAAREALVRSWTLWTLSAPVLLGAAALFASEGPSLVARWRAPLSLRDLVAAGALALALACLLAPRASLRAAGIEAAVDRLSAAVDLLWWWPWRWREILVGAPSLVLAFSALGRLPTNFASGTSSPFSDPRGWLALGLFAPAGTVAAIGAGNVPGALAVAQGAAAFALGAALGFALVALRTRIESWVQRPMDPGLLT